MKILYEAFDKLGLCQYIFLANPCKINNVFFNYYFIFIIYYVIHLGAGMKCWRLLCLSGVGRHCGRAGGIGECRAGTSLDTAIFFV